MTILALICAILTIVGLALTIRAIYPRRRGDTPYCRKCRYNLTGLDLADTATRCPECGAELAEKRAIICGERQRSVWRIAAAVVVLLAGLVPLAVLGIGTARNVDWYEYKPLAWVISDLASADSKVRFKASKELQRRWDASLFSRDQAADVFDACLARQEDPNNSMFDTYRMVELLDHMHGSNRLDDQQTDRYFAAMLRPELMLRPRVVEGDPLPVGTSVECFGPIRRYFAQVRIDRVRIDAAEYEVRGMRGFDIAPRPVPMSMLVRLPLSPGSHGVELDVSWAIYDLSHQVVENYSWRPIPPTAPARRYHGTCVLSGTCVVTPRNVGSSIAVRHSPALDDAVAASVGIRDLKALGGSTMNGMVDFAKSLPIDLAFDVFAEFGIVRANLGRLTHAKGGRSRTYLPMPLLLFEIPPEKVTLIFRASEEAALQTPDIFEIWDGELWFEHVTLVTDVTELRKERPPVRGQVRRRGPVPNEVDYLVLFRFDNRVGYFDHQPWHQVPRDEQAADRYWDKAITIPAE